MQPVPALPESQFSGSGSEVEPGQADDLLPPSDRGHPGDEGSSSSEEAAIDRPNGLDYEWNEETGYGEPKMIKPYRSWQQFLGYIFTPARIVVIALLFLGGVAIPKFSDLPARNIAYFEDGEKKKKILTKLNRAESVYGADTMEKTKMFSWPDPNDKKKRVYCEPNVDGEHPVKAGWPNRVSPNPNPKPEEIQRDEIDRSFLSWRQYVVLNLLILMIVFMVEGIPPELSIFGFVVVCYFFSYITYTQPLQNYCKNAPDMVYDAEKQKWQYGISIEPFLFLTSAADVFGGLQSKAALQMTGTFILSFAFKETRILEKALGSKAALQMTGTFILSFAFKETRILALTTSNTPITQITIPLLDSLCDRVGRYSPRVYYMSLMMMIVQGGNLALVGNTPGIYISSAFRYEDDQGRPTKQTHLCRIALAKAHSWPLADTTGKIDNDAEAVNKQIIREPPPNNVAQAVQVWNTREATTEPGWRYLDEKYEQIVKSQCQMTTFDLGFLVHGLILCFLGLPGVYYAISVFAKEEDGRKAAEAPAGSSRASTQLVQEGEFGADDENRPRSLSRSLTELGDNTTFMASGINGPVDEESRPLLSGGQEQDLEGQQGMLVVQGTPVAGGLAAGKRPPTYDVEFHLDRSCKELIGQRLSETRLFKMPGVKIYLHVEAGSKQGVLAGGPYIGGPNAESINVGSTSRPFTSASSQGEGGPLVTQNRQSNRTKAPKPLISPKKFFLEHDAVLLGVDKENGFALVEGFGEFGTRKFPNSCQLVRAVPGSRPARSVTVLDTVRGAVGFALFLLIIVFAAIPDFKIGNFKMDDQLPNLFLILGALLVMVRAISWSQALSSVNAGVILLFVFAVPLQQIMATSNTSGFLTKQIERLSFGSPAAAVIWIGIVSTNATVTQLLWDPMLDLAMRMGMPFKPMIILLATTSGYAYMTPIGSPPNLVIQVPGNYSFGDFLRSGWLMNVVCLVGTLLIVIGWLAYERGARDGEEADFDKFLFK
eukprot:g18868.t1